MGLPCLSLDDNIQPYIFFKIGKKNSAYVKKRLHSTVWKTFSRKCRMLFRDGNWCMKTNLEWSWAPDSKWETDPFTLFKDLTENGVRLKKSS